MRRKMRLFVLAVLLVLSCAITASAQGFDHRYPGSITVNLIDPYDKKPIEGAKFDVYYVASVGSDEKDKLFYSYTEAFQNCGISLTDEALSTKLSAYVAEKKLSAEKQIITDKKGKAATGELPLGFYLVTQAEAAEGYSCCTPFMVSVPMKHANAFVYAVEASLKTDVIRLVDITVKKVWNSGSSSTPSSVQVQLLRDDTVVETATLNKSNNWQITYKDMPQSDSYKIKEVNVPSGYKDTYSQSGYVFTVTNSAALAQTGQLVWPIPVLAMAGLVFLLMGFLILRKPGKCNA